MKKIKDLFSGHSDIYRKFRPTYPKALYDVLLACTPGRTRCWDCATGNGQVALALSESFGEVHATDISENQLSKAPRHKGILYSVQRAEKTNFPPGTFNLITVGQAVHWFDIPAFYKEARRVAIPGAALAIWGYGLIGFKHAATDAAIAHFYEDVVGPYWDFERGHIESGYQTIPFPFEDTRAITGLHIEKPMSLSYLKGYLTSWSAVQNYIKAVGDDPVVPLIDTLQGIWGNTTVRTAVIPLFGKIGRIN